LACKSHFVAWDGPCRELARDALAGAAAAAVWAATEPLDRRLFASDYSDIALLGKFVTRRHWRVAGLAFHLCNGAAFGLTYSALKRKPAASGRHFGLRLALAENMLTFPLMLLVERHHPAAGSTGIPWSPFNPTVFAQATLRHALFGLVLDRLAQRSR
jgi:hypothetical protein